MQRVVRGVLVALAVVALAVAGYVLDHHDRVPHAGDLLALPSQSASVAQSAAARNRPVVAFLGDDWTAGAGASKQAKRFTTLLSQQLGIDERNFGVAGAGYAKPSPAGGTYASRIRSVVAAHPQVVVVSGGRNDVTDLASTVDEAARQLFKTLHADLPHATLIAIAPMWGDSNLPPQLAALGKAVQAAVTRVGGTYLDVPDPIHGHPSYMADAADPNDRGYAEIATTLAPLIEPLLSR